MDSKKREEKPYKILSRDLGHSYVPQSVFRWRANPRAGTQLQQLLDSSFWDLVSDKFSVREARHQGQVIEVYPEDGAYYAELLAIRLSNGDIKIRKLNYVDIDNNPLTLKREDFKIEFRGKRKFSILRAKDNHLIEEHIDSKELAENKLKEFIANS